MPSKPSAPSPVSVFRIENLSGIGNELGIQVNWTAAVSDSPIVGYKLFMGEDELPMTVPYDGSSSNRPDILSFTISSGVKRSIYYKFRVQAFNRVGGSEISDVTIIHASVPPSAPINLNVTGSDEGSVSLEWEPPLDDGGSLIVNYKVYYKLYSELSSSPNTWDGPVTIDGSLNSYTLTGLTATENYRIRIVAVNSDNSEEGELSNSVDQYASAVPSGIDDYTDVNGDLIQTI